MTDYDFDRVIDRQQFPTQKWNPADLHQHFGSTAVQPFWIADMDFSAPPVVVEKLLARVAQGVYGYEYRPDSLLAAVTDWYSQRHHWSIPTPHIQPCPGVLSALTILIDQHSQPGDGIIVQPPVFFEFRLLIRKNDRRICKNPLQLVGGRYEMDFDNLEAVAADPRNKILILCNPHNPVGRVWARSELARVDEICRRHGVRIISDEIHGDIVYSQHSYTPLASLGEACAQNAFILLSPAKTFNLAGITDGMVVITNDQDRASYDQFADRFQINRNNIASLVAIETAYRQGADWLDALLDYLWGNVSYLRSFLAAELPEIKLVEPDGTYLVWLDFRGLNLEADELARFLSEDAKLALNAGYWFGREGAGFMRMNIAAPRSMLMAAMKTLKQAVDSRNERP